MTDTVFQQIEWPFEITDDQKSAVHRKWSQQNQDLTLQDFAETIQPTSHMDGAIVVQWSGMWLAIEKDGYTHS